MYIYICIYSTNYYNICFLLASLVSIILCVEVVCLVLLTLYPCWFFTHCVGIDIGAEAEADGANAVVTDGRVDWVDPTGASFVVFARSSVLAI